MNPTGQEVIDFWAYMCAHFKSSVVAKEKATEMSLVGAFLDGIGILKKEDFLSRFTTTIGNKIYVPFQIGSGSDAELWSQVLTCVHEHQHIVQSRKEPWTYSTSYLVDKSSRVRYESEAYATAMELDYWRFRKVGKPSGYASSLIHYGLGPEHVAVAEKIMSISSLAIQRGAVLSESARVALRWLDAKAFHWKEFA